VRNDSQIQPCKIPKNSNFLEFNAEGGSEMHPNEINRIKGISCGMIENKI